MQYHQKILSWDLRFREMGLLKCLTHPSITRMSEHASSPLNIHEWGTQPEGVINAYSGLPAGSTWSFFGNPALALSDWQQNARVIAGDAANN